ncbi:MAG: carboxymuconolactone decarboxylase family protein [Thermoplasmata archaeon]
MSKEFDEIKRFAESTLGELPEVIKLLDKFDEKAAIEQFNENLNLYLGGKNLPKKIAALVALSVAVANGPKESAMIHFKLARKFGAEDLEIIDSLRAAKMSLMSSTLSAIDNFIDNEHYEIDEETENILKRVENESGIVPERIKNLSKFSKEMLKEHLREKVELLNSKKLEKKYVFIIAYAVSASIHDRECEKVYLNQIIKNNGSIDEIQEAINIVRFITGNRAFVNALDILRSIGK